jgi:hypothetical protein
VPVVRPGRVGVAWKVAADEDGLGGGGAEDDGHDATGASAAGVEASSLACHPATNVSYNLNPRALR